MQKLEDIKIPSDLVWVEGELPPPSSVPVGTQALVWGLDWEGNFSGIFRVNTREDKLNPLYWDGSYPYYPYGSVSRYCLIEKFIKNKFFKFKENTPNFDTEILYKISSEDAESVMLEVESNWGGSWGKGYAPVKKEKGTVIIK